MADRFTKQNDYTLSVSQDLPSGGLLTRQFNFASEQVTTIYERKASLSDHQTAGVAASVALSSQMTIQKFSDLDSQAEVEIMREKLLADNGKITEASNGKAKLSAKLAS